MDEPIFLYSFRRCPFAMRVRIALHEKEIAFKVVEEDLKNFSSRLISLHPEAKVPLFVQGQRVIYESAIITEYVDDLPSTKKKLMPEDPAERAEVRLWTYWCNYHFKPAIDRFKYGTARFAEQECQGSEEKVISHLEKMESRLSQYPWLVGKNFTLAEVHLFPFIRQLSRIQPSPSFLERFPHTQNWRDKIGARETVIRALET
ncbi:MAG: glutathione S-transferase family protein [Proteobacteria bacterium]|nr:glutathione S-transferase family protein [Pseudomonadota bacterium]NDC23997.1 glutathione S-transferase family protein [Pseudomonadota bacterium]NDD03819.1 glutathione S-transferase family protein [Pseudomonadota bacterium]NDG26079.1 glutathione S-transferase family protein [Pseudomonadota bacterium]